MLRKVACSLLLTIASQSVLADQVFQCSEATVTMSVDTTLPLRSTEGAEVMLRVERGSRSTLLRYSNVDFIGGTCDTDASSAPRVVYQAVCSGSGCFDLSNWGVIDAESLQALLVPANDSLEPATHLLGHQPTLMGVKKMNVSEEARRLGLPAP